MYNFKSEMQKEMIKYLSNLLHIICQNIKIQHVINIKF